MRTEQWYADYYRARGEDRNDLLANPGVLFQHLAIEEAPISALRMARGLDRASALVLDVGCGSGASLTRFLQLGFPAGHLFGVDVLRERLEQLHAKYPRVRLACGDAAAMPYPPDRFDLVLESTMFVQLTDEALASRIAREMVRVVKPGGYLLVIDWRYGRPGNTAYRAVSRSRIAELFGVGKATRVVDRRRVH